MALKKPYTFEMGEKVVWRHLSEIVNDDFVLFFIHYGGGDKEAFFQKLQEALREFIRLYGKGPFLVVEVDNIGVLEVAPSFHHQIVRIEAEDGRMEIFSGMFLKPIK